MKNYQKALSLVIGMALVTSGALGYSSYHSTKKIIESAKQTEMHNVSTLIQNDLRDQANKAAARASLIVHLPSIQQAFRQQNREELTRRLLPAFLIQRDRYGVREAMFHLPPATSFLRLFDLKNFGENLSAFREIVLTTNQQQKPQQGVEIGRRGLSIRGVDLVKDEKGPIGSFEVGMSFTPILENIKQNTGFEAAVFVDDHLMATIATAIARPDQEHILGGFQSVESTDWEKILKVVTPSLLNKVTDISYKLESVDGQDYGLVIIPLLDFKGLHIGSIIAVADFENYRIQMEANMTNSIALSLLQAIMLVGAIMIGFKIWLEEVVSVEAVSIEEKGKEGDIDENPK